MYKIELNWLGVQLKQEEFGDIFVMHGLVLYVLRPSESLPNVVFYSPV